MSSTLNLQIQDVISETEEAVTLRFKKPFLRKLDYLPGQFLTLMLKINGKSHQRSYSISSLNRFDKYVSVTVKKVKDGLVSNFLCDKVKKGDKLTVLRPLGSFVYKPDVDSERHVLLIGGGSGITPLMAILKAVLFSENKSKVTLLYANRNPESVIFRAKLEEYAEQFSDRFKLINLLAESASELKTGVQGRLDNEVFESLIQQKIIDYSAVTDAYICGPEGLMDVAKECVLQKGFPEDRLFLEQFFAAIGVSTPLTGEKGSIGLRKPGTNEIDVVEADMDTSILQNMLTGGQSVSYSCGTGVCGSCKCKLVEGEVETTMMALGLTEEDKSNNIILPCISKNKTKEITLEIVE